jgi:hypothetical protein
MADGSDVDEDTDYDASDGTRWYFRIYRGPDGLWFWEPRTPTHEERENVHVIQGMTFTPMILSPDKWPADGERGPYRERGQAITAAETWFSPPDA